MTTLETDVEPLDVPSAQAVYTAATDDSFTNLLIKSMRLANEDQLDVLERSHPAFVHAERVRRQDPTRLKAVATIAHRHQCPECGWPTFDGYNNGTMDGDAEPYGYCLNQKCDYQY